MKYLVTAVLFILTVGACFLLGEYLSRKRHKKTRSKKATASQFPLSAFSVLDHPAATFGQEQFSPQREAAVYMTYGKRREAEQVLNMAQRSGKVTAEDVAAFWAQYDAAA